MKMFEEHLGLYRKYHRNLLGEGLSRLEGIFRLVFRFLLVKARFFDGLMVGCLSVHVFIIAHGLSIILFLSFIAISSLVRLFACYYLLWALFILRNYKQNYILYKEEDEIKNYKF